jgi:hypothetical protein
MAYITQSNLRDITYRYKLPETLTGQLYKKKIDFFNKNDRKRLLLIRKLIDNTSKLMIGSWKEIKPKTSKDLVFESNPSYHFSMSCELLNKDYENFYIPKEILEKGDEKINEFKKWFKSTKHLLDGKVDVFEYRWHNKWNFHVNVKKIYIENSGVSMFENQSIKQIEAEINFLLKEAQHLTDNYPAVIKKYGKFAKQNLSRKAVKDNDTGMNDKEIREILLKLEFDVKDPLKQLLVNWYRAKQSPELKFDGKILDQLGFKACPRCASAGYVNKDKQKKVEKEVFERSLVNQKNPRIPSHEITRGLVSRNLSVIEMAAIRNMTATTIVNHLEKISIDFGTELIEYLRPTKEVLTLVAGAIHLTKGVKRSEIFEFLESRIDYTQINLALIFLGSEHKAN